MVIKRDVRHMVLGRAGMAFVVIVLLGCAVNAAAAPVFRSPQEIIASADGKLLYVCEATANAVAVVDTAKDKVARRIELADPPGGLALSADGKTLYITAAVPQGMVRVVDAASGKVQAEIAAGHTPVAPVLSPDGALLYVCNRFNNDVAVIDLASKTTLARVPVTREPVAAALTPDGKLLYVANLVPDGPSDGDYTGAVVSVIDTAARSLAATVALPNGSTGLHGVCVSPDGAHVYVTHILARYQMPTTQLERGWMNTNALSVLDAASMSLVNTVLLDDVDLGGANPWAVACTADGKSVCVTHAGTHEISVIDRAALHDRLARAAAGERVTEVSSSAGDVPNDLSFLVGLRRRIKLAGNGPRGLWVDGATAYATQYFTDDIAVVDLAAANPAASAKRIELGDAAPTPERLGERHFFDAALCFQHWQSCGSCHPDARVDGLNWDLLNDGIGNPKNTKSMLLSHETPPAMSLGVRDGAEVAVRAGIRHIQFAVRPEEDAVAIDLYLKSLKPVPSPLLEGGKLGAAAERGKALFAGAKCADCHTPPHYTDMKVYELGTARGLDEGKPVDTPALAEVWRTAPYLHDGRSATIMDVLKKDNPDNRHGDTAGLTEQELADLAAYVLSL
ncbi:MAG: c-type cytochrome [Candidatus Hydrogenedentes bacterium]|nr:c-type cytochrome [Candidatus Hydrogenedentota bacterium]